jgi:uncharacterized membrane protein YtjA (UPF0391 family)
MKIQIAFLVAALVLGAIGWLGLGPSELHWVLRPVSVILLAAFLISHFMGREERKYEMDIHPEDPS